ncbi:hypothetical protein Tco_1216999 [Tanacetum coccineum]
MCSCGALYTSDYCCSKGGLEDKILVPKTPDSSQRPPQDCVKCGNPVEGPNCQGCALWRKKLKEVWFILYQFVHGNGIYRPSNTYESSDDDTNVVNAPREPFVIESFVNDALTDFLLKEFAGELALIAPIPPGIVEADFNPKGDIRFIENLMYDNSFPYPPETLKDDSETVIDSNNDYSSSDDDSPYSEDINYVDASPPDSELVSLEVVEIFIPEVGEIDTDILLTIKDDVLREKLLNVNLLIAKIKALKDNPTPYSDFVTKSSSTSLNFFLEETNTFDNSLPESKTFCFNLEEISSGIPTSYLDLSLPDYEAFFCDSEPDSRNFTMDVVEDIFDNPTREPRVHVPNVLPTHLTLQLDSDFTLSCDSLGSDLVVSFPYGTRNKIFRSGDIH